MNCLPSKHTFNNSEANHLQQGVRGSIPLPFASVTFSDGYHAMVLEKWGVSAAAMTFSRSSNDYYLSTAIGFPGSWFSLNEGFTHLSEKVSSNGYKTKNSVISLGSEFGMQDRFIEKLRTQGLSYLRVFQINDILTSSGYWFLFFDNFEDAENITGKVAQTLESPHFPHDLDDMSNFTADPLHMDDVIANWVKLLDSRDKETEEHTERVATLAVSLAQKLGVPPEDLINIYRGALLHDVGKVFIPNEILFKPGKLSADEWKIMKMHPVIVNELLTRFSIPKNVLEIPHCHHEKWDGNGYPNHLQGEEIPLSARIFAVVDVWDALISDRPYRPSFTIEEAETYIKDQSGSHFDPTIAQKFLEMLPVSAL